jgi:DNA-binding transcriptional LysR family regulator
VERRREPHDVVERVALGDVLRAVPVEAFDTNEHCTLDPGGIAGRLEPRERRGVVELNERCPPEHFEALNAVGETARPQGRLTLTASVTFGRFALAPIVRAFLAAYPRVQASLLLLDRLTSLVDEGIDAAVRIGPLPDSSLVARRLGDVRRVLVASPDYLHRHGVPDTPQALRNHEVIAFTGLMPNREWRYADDRGGGAVPVSARFEVNDALAALTAAEQGDGISIALSYMVEDALRTGRLVTVLGAFTPPAVPVHLVYPPSRLMAPKLRTFIDFAVPRLAAVLDGLSVPTDRSREGAR